MAREQGLSYLGTGATGTVSALAGLLTAGSLWMQAANSDIACTAGPVSAAAAAARVTAVQSTFQLCHSGSA